MRTKPTLEDGWAKVVHRLNGFVEAVARRFRQNPLDVWGDVGLAFMHAHRTFDPQKNDDFAGWCTTKVYKFLFSAAKARARRAAKEVQPSAEIGLSHLPSACAAPWPIDEFAGALPADARDVVLLAVGQPPAVRAKLRARGLESPGNVRWAVRQVLKEDGWSQDRIEAAFLEVRTAVASLYTAHFRADAPNED